MYTVEFTNSKEIKTAKTLEEAKMLVLKRLVKNAGAKIWFNKILVWAISEW